jgi:hypothetical protein
VKAVDEGCQNDGEDRADVDQKQSAPDEPGSGQEKNEGERQEQQAHGLSIGDADDRAPFVRMTRRSRGGL